MTKAVMFLLSAAILGAGLALMEAGERMLTAGVFAILALVVWWISGSYQRVAPEVPWVCHVAGSIAVSVGVVTVLSGVGHSAGVTALALREAQWAPVTILRFTTGMMLVYSGAMSIALYRGIRTGRRWAVGVGFATTLLFWSYLLLMFPLVGTRGTVPPMLALWTTYLIWLGAAMGSTMGRNAGMLEPRPAALAS